jgi:hypothetical protein
MGVSHARTSFDQDLFHLKVIVQFSTQWPRLDLRDYLSATTPGLSAMLMRVSMREGGEPGDSAGSNQLMAHFKKMRYTI